MPEPGEDLRQQADAGGRRAVMGVARTRARHVGGVARGEEDAARAVAEQVESLGREPSRGVEVGRLAARLEQSERGARHRGVIVEQRAGAGMSIAPGVQQPAVRRAASS